MAANSCCRCPCLDRLSDRELPCRLFGLQFPAQGPRQVDRHAIGLLDGSCAVKDPDTRRSYIGRLTLRKAPNLRPIARRGVHHFMQLFVVRDRRISRRVVQNQILHRYAAQVMQDLDCRGIGRLVVQAVPSRCGKALRSAQHPKSRAIGVLNGEFRDQCGFTQGSR